jgi:UDP-N-acetylglucosamine diphosphorylase/glucosamine-1-phosphate N-acetyltransferase
VYIGANTRIEPQAALAGPCYIGPNSVVVAGKIAGSSIGHTCRVGGEVEECIFQAYVNKYHAGFVGHSYVGAWVNFGAMTTNSDLKNNYSNIRVSLGGESIDTGSIKVGSFIGDHTKFGIGTLLTTGIVIGVCSNVFGGGLVTDKEVPSFAWGTTGGYQPYKIEKALETVARTMQRRNIELTSHETALLRAIHTGKPSTAGCLGFRVPG